MSGKKANKTGSNLEQFIGNILEQEGYTFLHKDKFFGATVLEQPIYTQQCVIGQSIYEGNLKCDFILRHPQKQPSCLVIEAKWQQTNGSVDHKFPKIVLDIGNNPYNTIIIIDGGKIGKKALQWLKNQEKSEMSGGKLLHVFSMAEFQKWVNDENL